MQCNIDARGKAARLIFGVMMLAVGLTLLVLKWTGVLTADWWWFVSGGFIGFGGLGVYEARAGWCVMRAMGFRTPM